MRGRVALGLGPHPLDIDDEAAVDHRPTVVPADSTACRVVARAGPVAEGDKEQEDLVSASRIGKSPRDLPSPRRLPTNPTKHLPSNGCSNYAVVIANRRS